MSTATVFDLDGFDPPTIRWGKHTKNIHITRIFNDLFSFELSDEAWHDLFTNDPEAQPVDIARAIVPTDIVERDQCDVVNYGFDIDTDRVSNCAYVRNLDDKSSASKMFSSTCKTF